MADLWKSLNRRLRSLTGWLTWGTAWIRRSWTLVLLLTNCFKAVIITIFDNIHVNKSSPKTIDRPRLGVQEVDTDIPPLPPTPTSFIRKNLSFLCKFDKKWQIEHSTPTHPTFLQKPILPPHIQRISIHPWKQIFKYIYCQQTFSLCVEIPAE